MSTKTVDYKIILKRDGQTQQQRMPQWLDPTLVPVDDRTKRDFFNYIKEVARQIKFFDLGPSGNDIIINGTWEDFFNMEPDEISVLAARAALPPHLTLWNAFIELYEQPKQLMNGLAKRHLDFYYAEVLRLKQRDPLPDKAHVVFELKKNTANTLLQAGTSLLAGKDDTKKELHYLLAHDVVVNDSAVARLMSVHVNPSNKNFIHQAPVANSSDGLGAALNKMNPKWNAFGTVRLPLASIGFCLAAPVLKMKEGDRTVSVKLTLANLTVNAKNSSLLTNLFSISITGEKGWIGPKSVSPVISSGDNKNFDASFTFFISKDDPAVVPYSTSLHGGSLDTSHPVLQVLLNNSKADFGYKDLQHAELIDATIEVTVTGITNLQAENDFGALNVKKPFTPFGPAPEANANLSIGNEEAFSKRLKAFYFDVEWKNIPDNNLGNYFLQYGAGNANADFTAIPAFKDGVSWEERSAALPIFNTSNAQVASRWEFTNPAFAVRRPVIHIPEISVKSYAKTGLSLQQKISGKMSYLNPAFTPQPAKSVGTFQLKALVASKFSYVSVLQGMTNAYKDVRKGMFSLRLKHGFFFKEYPKRYTEVILTATKEGKTPVLPAEPFAPEIQSITLNYTATTAKTSFKGTSLADFMDEEIEFFHYGAFGQMREHAYAKSQSLFLSNTLVNLLPGYNNEGEFYIGLTGLQAGESACILFQVAPGSANPERPKADLQWSVLCDNYWKELTNEDLIFDTTNDLLTSGVMKFVIPEEATTSNTILPGGLLWIRASLSQHSDAVCELVDVQSNAAVVLFDNRDNDKAHFSAALKANTINKLETGNAAIKSVKQPYASFNGRPAEKSEAFYTRVSERLRHKERSIGLWDYERLILEHFPQVHKVKCINHATLQSYYEPGNVRIIVVPDLKNQNAINIFQPRLDKYILEEISEFLKRHGSNWTEIHVGSPSYEPVKIAVKIKLKRGFEFNYYQQLIDVQLQELLSPWVGDSTTDIYFGGKITKSMIVKFLENLDFIDFIADLRLFQSLNNGLSFGSNVEVVEASGPAAILVSHNHHEIGKV